MGLTFFLVTIGLIIFRSENISQAIDYLSSMFTHKFFDFSMLHGVAYTCLGFVLLAAEWIQRDKQHALQFPNTRIFKLIWIRWAIYLLIINLIIFTTYSLNGKSQTFIYFQF